MRAHEQKKATRLAHKRLVKEGKMPTSEGNWVPNTATTSMGRDLKGGHRVT